MTVYPRRRAHIVPEIPIRLRRPVKRRLEPEKDTPMKYLTAEVRCGRKVYEAHIPIPAGATADPHAMAALKNRLRLMIAHDILGRAPVTFRTESMAGVELRRVR